MPGGPVFNRFHFVIHSIFNGFSNIVSGQSDDRVVRANLVDVDATLEQLRS